MKTFRKILSVLLIFIVIVAIAGFFFVKHISKKALPDYSKPVYLHGLTDEVRVYRDKFAMPHIYAKNEHDLYLTVGYLMAQDRLWQMDVLRRVTLGRLSEIFGKDMVGTDQLLRALRIPEKSNWVLSETDDNVLLALNAFADGVNQYIEQNQKKLPPEFTILGYKPEVWLPVHTINLIGYMAWDLAGSWQNEILLYKLKHQLDDEKLRQLIPDLSFHKSFVFPKYEETDAVNMFTLLEQSNKLKELGLEIFSASNSWAVTGEKSKTGNALFSNDMHLGFGAPGIWYQMHHVIEGQLNVTGVALPGAPLIIVGHNDHIAWGMTNLYVDEMDFYFETLNEDSTSYLFNNEWEKLEIRKEHIVTGKKDTVIRVNRFTHRGPVISDFKKISTQAISMRWTGSEFSNELRSIYLFNRAKTWDEFRDASSTLASVSQNVTYADIYGNIGIQTCGAVPVRKAGHPIFIYPGDTDEYDWTGLLPFEELPYVYNPPEGYVSSANNKTTDDDYPHYIGHWFSMPYRIDRIREMINAKDKLGTEDFKEMLGDFHSKLADRYTDELVNIISTTNDLSVNEQKALSLLSSWDRTLTAESTATTIFEEFYATFIKNSLADELGEDLFKELSSVIIHNMFEHLWRDPLSSWIDNVNTQHTETFDEIVLLSFKETVEWLEKNVDKDPANWKWGNIHQLNLKHFLGSVKILDKIFGFNKGPFSVGGSFHTVNPMAYSFHNPYSVVHGASQRHVFNMANLAESYVIIPTGISGIPASKYYCDQIDMFLNNEFKKDLWLEQDIVSKAAYQTVFMRK